MQLITNFMNRLGKLCALIPEDLVSLLARVAVASVFWRSAQTKISGWDVWGQSLQFFNVSESTKMLFEYEYQVPLLPPVTAAYMATTAEFFLSMLLVLGLCTRCAALGLLGVTAVIQLFVLPDGWPVHILWIALLLYLLKSGGGRISIDALFLRRSK